MFLSSIIAKDFMTTPNLNKSIDAIDTFLLYHLLSGNATLTALTIGVNPGEITKLATSGSWGSKLKANNRPYDSIPKKEQFASQFLNQLQLGRLQALVDKILCSLNANQSLADAILTVRTKNATASNTRALAELVDVASAAQNMSCRLGIDPGSKGGLRCDASGEEITACFSRAMAVADDLGLDSVALLRGILWPTQKPI